uniref:aquaporin-8-like isoform X2 n=1 Tax=Ciona intestinalis TaxID=7719 RepID=UPI00089DC26E|nr:aquaporin-8-like isoform X2 [Ciona intestinalis]|eukprot:XP_018672120.1 aquaporin-8-like isoform X2 [Ciona intestinalis]
MTAEKKTLQQKWKESSRAKIYIGLAQPLLAEFFTMILHTFWGSMVVATNIPIHYSALNRTIQPQEWAADYLVSTFMPAFQAGFAVWMFIVLFWNICVINFNPAISVGLAVAGVLSPWLLLPYIIMQCLGSILGAVIAQAIKNDEPGPFLIPDDANISAILCCEVMITGCMVFFTVTMVVDKTYNQATGPLAIGLTVFQGIIAGKWIGAGCLNPSRAFGPAVVLGGRAWNYHWVWWVGDCAGAFIFAVIYMCFFAPKDKVWIVKVMDWMKPDEVVEDDIGEHEENNL